MSVSAAGYDLTPLTPQQVDEKAAGLTDEERRVLLDHGTERPFCGTLLDNKNAGAYYCRLCELPLFSSDSKFDSGTGWPSFFQPFDTDHIRYIEDNSMEWLARRSAARVVTAILGTCFQMGHHQPASATA